MVIHGAAISNVFGTAPSSGTTLDFSAIGALPLDLGELDNPITDDEIWAAIKDMPSDRALGPDGFPGAFYRTTWSTIKPQVMDAIHAFCYGNKQRLNKLNNATVVLLPKREGANTPADFRPITMIHSFAKLLSKILAMRLAPRLKDIVDKNQNAFIQGRSIHDNYKFIQRAAVLIRTRKQPMLLLKLDISKAFDTLSWPFLLEVLQAHGFRDKWCG